MKPQEIITEHKLTLPEVLGMLVIDGMVSQSAADALIADQRLRRHTGHPFTIIAAQNWKSQQAPNHVLNADSLAEWMARRTGLEYFHIDPLKIDFTGLTEIMSNEYAARFGILPVQLTKTEVVIATSEPFLRDWESVIRQLTRREVRRVISAPEDINRYLVEFFNLARSVKKAAQSKHQDKSSQASFEQLVEMGKSNRQLDANDQHIVHIVDWLWQYAFEQRASDIHIEPRRDIGIVRFRIDGVLHQVYQIPMPVMTAMTSRIKLLGRMDVVEKRRPQDGRIKTRTAEGQEIELRLSTLPTAFGEKLVMRIFDPEVLVRDFSELGFSDEDSTRWRQMTAQPNGIILVTRGQRLHHRRPDRNDRAGIQPDAGTARHRHRFRRRRTLADAAGPGHHHGRRDPRSGNCGNGNPGCAHRPPGAVHTAHQRRTLGHHAPA